MFGLAVGINQRKLAKEQKEKKRKKAEEKIKQKALQKKTFGAFKFVDKNGDGYITKGDFLTIMTEQEIREHGNAVDEAFAAILEKHDSDNCGKINYQ